MTKEERVSLVERIAEQLTDACDMDSLLMAYYDQQIDYFTDLSDDELLSQAEDIL